MASSADPSQPLLGDQQQIERRQQQQRSDDVTRKSSSPSASHDLLRRITESHFIGNRMPSWSSRGDGGEYGHRYHDYYNEYYREEPSSSIPRLRAKARSALSSKWGHYAVLFLVAVDVACIFAEFLIELHTCELRERHQVVDRRWEIAQEALGLSGLIFSCLFMVELIVTVLSFGLHYFKSKFHIFDAIVIVVAFVFDVALRGLVEELGSLVVILRLWRVFKIIEEMSEVSAEMMEKYEDEIDKLKHENMKLKRKLRGYGDEDDDMEANAGGDEEEDNND
ncbi:hypothetical protein BGW36DRAFT_366576 [Talaromyces proteolyticus]|uniref:Voltage-gated hydrogen channel 1 n=1 Tax=Talaromyces proteolyticus TaxID=1131652 RepID=A0AAD4L303_9EURO|nr:uncharacterized protein BGW36DRAFT_366576 [Talaromyces proteolyticus]KAH8704978.1 hypothetical protein BGW36DRAFT_366576 [Talaromyces proteolyticus]